MIIKCEKCQTVYNLDAKLLKEKGSPVRCNSCGHIFKVYPRVEKRPSPLPEPSSRPKPFSIGHPKPDKPGHQAKKKHPVPRKPDTGRKYMPFKKKLIYFAAALIFVIGLIVIPFEVYRPIQKLHELIDVTRNLISGVQAAFEPAELERMNQFALNSIKGTGAGFITEAKERSYFFLSFNMLLLEGKILPKEQMEIAARKGEVAGFDKAFDYEKLDETQYYWRMRFAEDQGIFEILQKYKRILRKAKENAASAVDFTIADIYIMLDSGKEEDFFKDHIAFLLDGYHWSEEPSYCGEPYKVASGTWRDSALAGKEGFGNSAVSDPDNWYLPHFVADEWGAWFGVWLTKKTGGIYNMFTIDFDASIVKELMADIAMLVGGVILLLTIMVALITRWLSGLVTQPITELTKGAEEVSGGNYDYEVPVLKKDEFGELTKQFNQMTRGQKERLNLMDALERLLSKELAEMAAKEGLVLGGQKADCTVMFTDFGGFSTITQKMTAWETVEILNLYFDALIPIVREYGGFPDKYIGDAIVALFGAPVTMENHAERAVCAAITMQRRMREINDRRREQVCFKINELSLAYLKSEGVSGDILQRLEHVGRQGVEYLKLAPSGKGMSDETLETLKRMEKQEFLGKGELLEGEYLDRVLKAVVRDKQEIGIYRSMMLKFARKNPSPWFEMRIGLNSGEVIAGAIGCDMKLEYTSIGETTNLANRMEASCEISHVAIAEGTYLRIKNVFFQGVNISATPDEVEVKGMGKVPVYRVYVNNLKVSKDMKNREDITRFYVYEAVDHRLRNQPEEVKDRREFDSIAKFL